MEVVRGPEEEVDTVRAIPRPTRADKSGEPKQLAMAVLTWPALAVAVSATRSPTLLPHASTVRPRILVDMLARAPKASRTATTSLAMRSSQTTDMQNANITENLKKGGWLSSSLQNQRTTLRARPARRATSQMSKPPNHATLTEPKPSVPHTARMTSWKPRMGERAENIRLFLHQKGSADGMDRCLSSDSGNSTYQQSKANLPSSSTFGTSL
mmetsp:Transcript_16125/g.32884  ORF Transcript_16125/g.32884 Transcript_16125/m.32884 type:complete len:212 (+) Transcript_16125:200-835(+)